MALPREPTPDSTSTFFREGYRFIGDHCRALGSDAFETRLMLRRVTCVMGEDAAYHFYDGASFTRVGAMPPTTLRLLQDKNSVQSLDGEAHRHRKAMFLQMLTGPAVERIGRLFDERWRAAAVGWRRRQQIVLHDAAAELLCDVACAWAGVPVAGDTLKRRTREMMAMIAGAGTAGPRAWLGLLLRQRAERWARRAIADARAGRPGPAPVQQIAHHRDGQGNLLSVRTAGVELINLIRPTVAVARYIAFAGLALHEHPDAAAWLRGDVGARLPAFVDEVRRYYPFFPVIGGRVRRAFTWHDRVFAPGDWVLLGLHATNHDPGLWAEPQRFRPERFEASAGGAYRLVPQGAGEHANDHRCPGEWFTREIVARAVRQLLAMRYTVPAQRLDIPLDRFPTLPRDGFVIRFG